jgi:hypothetical protein
LTVSLRNRISRAGRRNAIPNTKNGCYVGNFDESDQSSPPSPCKRSRIPNKQRLLSLTSDAAARVLPSGVTMPAISRSIRLSRSADGGVLLDVNQGAIFSLNTVGLRILELLQEEQNTASVVGRISREFGAPEQLVLEDVEDFLRTLDEHGLLEGPTQESYDSAI